MLKDTLGIRGEVSIIVKDSNGNIKQSLHIPNLVVASGKEHIASRLAGTSSGIMSHMALGSGATSPVGSNAALESELGRVQLLSYSPSGASVTATATFASGVATGGITEAGLFNDDVDGTMLCRTTFPIVNKEEGDSITVSWMITVS